MPAPRRPVRRALPPIVAFLRTEAAGGATLAVAAVAALIWANAPFSASYGALWATDLAGHTLREWISDGLMALFFLVVGLEIRREVADGELSDRRTATLPAVAALGGMVVPGLVYVLVNSGAGGDRSGWAIPTATDIAFAVAVLALLGDRVPQAARAFLLALAVADDVGAILVIALFYGHGVAVAALVAAAVLVAAYAVAARRGLPWPLLLVLGVAAWFATRESGVHATIAGVALGLLTPAARGSVEGPAERLERRLHPWSVFVVLPLFALANLGVSLSAGALEHAAGSRVAWGVALGLAVGKPAGIVLATLVAVRTGRARLPDAMSWRTLAGVATVAGIGCTVSLFVTTLAFGASERAADATVGILVGSLVAGGVGSLVLAAGSPVSRRRPRRPGRRPTGPAASAGPGRPAR